VRRIVAFFVMVCKIAYFNISKNLPLKEPPQFPFFTSLNFNQEAFASTCQWTESPCSRYSNLIVGL